jgi:hypothetical protein
LWDVRGFWAGALRVAMEGHLGGFRTDSHVLAHFSLCGKLVSNSLEKIFELTGFKFVVRWQLQILRCNGRSRSAKCSPIRMAAKNHVSHFFGTLSKVIWMRLNKDAVSKRQIGMII